MAKITRTGKGAWSGDLKSGTGKLGTESGVLADQDFSFETRFREGGGTNPEELIAAAHAGCFSMAFAHVLSEKGYKPERVEATATCTLVPLDGGFKISGMTLDVRARVPGLDESELEEIAKTDGDKACVVSNALRGNVDITVNVTSA